MDASAVRTVERLNYLFGGVLVIAAALAATRAQALGVTIGVALVCLNFAVLRGLVYKWTAAVKAGQPGAGNRMFLLLPKMLGVMAAVIVVILFLPVDAIAFLIGYSIFFPSIIVAGVIDALRSGRAADDADPTTPPDGTSTPGAKTPR